MAHPTLAERLAEGSTTRMFDSDFFERFSRIHPRTIFMVWVPVATMALGHSIVRHEMSYVTMAAFFLVGILTWTLAEYLLHRWVFHWTNDTLWGKRIHFFLHGVHHDFPNDKDRLVMPLGVSIPMAVIFYTLFRVLLGQVQVEPFFAGFAVGYLMYDGTHYYVHHFVPTTRVGKYLRRHHLIHHNAEIEGGYGVSTPLWDVIFRTMPKKRVRAQLGP